MIEPFFASGSPLWTGTPSGAFSWPQAGQMPGLLQATPAMSLMTLDPAAARRPFGFAGGVPPTPTAVPGTVPLFAPSTEIPTGVSPSAVLGMIALRRGQPQGPATDQDTEEFLYDALELFSGTNEVEVRSEQGRVTLTGTVQQKRLKRDIGEIAWAIPTVADVQNNIAITTKRRMRGAGREQEAAAPARKQG